MKRGSRQRSLEESGLGEKLLRSIQQARDWVQGKPVRVRVTYVPTPQVDVRKLRARMGLSQTRLLRSLVFRWIRFRTGNRVIGSRQGRRASCSWSLPRTLRPLRMLFAPTVRLNLTTTRRRTGFGPVHKAG